MRKLSLLAAMVAVLTLSSCSNDQDLDNSEIKSGEISFRSFIDKGSATRSAVTTIDNILSFTVTAWWDKKTTPGSPVFGSSNTDEGGYLFNAFDITRRENGISDWDYDPKIYWPSKGSGVYFFAYSPASSKHVSATKGLYNYAGAEVEYAVPDPGAEEAQEDFLLARTGMLKNGVVNLNFAHALSRVTFSAKKEAGLESLNYLIKSVEMVNINKAGTIDLDNIPDDGDFSSQYSPTHNGPTVVYWTSSVPGNIAVDLGESPVYVRDDVYSSILGPTNALMVMPQETTLGDANLKTGFLVKVSYKAFVNIDDPGSYYAGTMGDGDATYKTVYFVVKDAARTAAAGSDVSHTFEIGRQYNFYLTFGSEAGMPIKLNVGVGNWNDAPQAEFPQIADYYGAGLISEKLAVIANSNYLAEGVRLGDIMSVESMTLDGFAAADVKGLEYFKNLTTLKFNQTQPLNVNLSGFRNLTNMTFGAGTKFSSLNISGITTRINISVPNYNLNSTSTRLDNLVTIDNLIVWNGFQTSSESDSRLVISCYTGTTGEESGVLVSNVTPTTGSTTINSLKIGSSNVIGSPATDGRYYK